MGLRDVMVIWIRKGCACETMMDIAYNETCRGQLFKLRPIVWLIGGIVWLRIWKKGDEKDAVVNRRETRRRVTILQGLAVLVSQSKFETHKTIYCKGLIFGC